MSVKANFEKPKRIEKAVRSALKDIRTSCIQKIKNKNYGLLTDNYYILATMGKECLENLKNAPKLPCKNGVPIIYTEIEKSVEKYGCLSQENFIAELSDKGFSADECTLVRLMAECAYIVLFSVSNESEGAADYIKGLRSLEEIDFEEIMCHICETDLLLILLQ